MIQEFRNVTCIYRKINLQKTIITTDLLTGVEVSRLSNIKTSLEMIRLRNFRNLHNIKKETIQKPINRHAQNFYIVLARAQSYFSKNTKKLIRQMTESGCREEVSFTTESKNLKRGQFTLYDEEKDLYIFIPCASRITHAV